MFLLVVATAGYTAWYVATPLSVARLPTEIEIPRGAGLRTAIEQLEKGGVAVRPLQFELLARSLGRERDVKAGNYQFMQPLTPLELLKKLTRGDVTQAEVRLIEGWTFAQFRAALDASPDLRHDTKGLDETEVLGRVGAAEPHPEGLFFPDTYLFARGTSDVAVLRRAYRAMQRHLADEWSRREQSIPYRTPYDALIMASIIEKETGTEADRALVAGVFSNRLRVGMALQTDPTVIYGLGAAFDGNLRKRDLLADGPYNTYTRPGLPPTPIALPGKASLLAAVRPAATKALYFVARGDGSSEFSENLADHNRAVNKYQRAPAARGPEQR